MLTTTVPTTTLEPALTGAAGGAIAGGVLFLLAIGIALEILMMVGLWKVASKAGIFGLWAIIPIVQLFTLARIAGKPIWWGLLCFVPLVNIVIIIIFYIEISKKFGKPVIVATELLSTMIKKTVPSKSEIADICPCAGPRARCSSGVKVAPGSATCSRTHQASPMISASSTPSTPRPSITIRRAPL